MKGRAFLLDTIKKTCNANIRCTNANTNKTALSDHVRDRFNRAGKSFVADSNKDSQIESYELDARAEVIRQFIPSLPKNIDEALQFWRLVCQDSRNIPIKKFRCAKLEKERIENYGDKNWRRVQKQLDNRCTRLVRIVASEINPPITDIFGESSSDEDWKSAIVVFKNKWGCTALTKVLNSFHCIQEESRNMRVVDERLIPLTENENDFLESTAKTKVKISAASISLGEKDWATLKGSSWINDDILNSFVALLNQRNHDFFQTLDSEPLSTRSGSYSGELLPYARSRNFMFSSFLFIALTNGGTKYEFERVKRWTFQSNIDIQNFDLILFPININNRHRVLASIDKRTRKIFYIDTLGGQDSKDVLPSLRK